jgi:hypothetical protein
MLDELAPDAEPLPEDGARVGLLFGIRRAFAPLHQEPWRWAVCVAHRRAGKTVAAVQLLVKRLIAAPSRPTAPPRFAYVAPTYAMARDIAWPYLVAYVRDIPGVDIRVSELSVTLPHNSGRIRLYGSENYDNLRGGYNDGMVVDETGDQPPKAWPEVLRPTLSDYQGWALFIGTPKGNNAFKEMAEAARKNETGNWLYLTLPASKTGILPPEELAAARTQMSKSQYEQEYECSFSAGVFGAYYANLIEHAEREKRITSVPYDPASDVYAAMDLGIGDSTCIWVYQQVGKELHFLTYMEESGRELGYYVDWLKALPYRVNLVILPHDAEAKELQTGNSRVEFLRSRGVTNQLVLPKHKIEDGIEAVRRRFPAMWFDHKTVLGLKALRNYRADYDERRKVFLPRPRHDWSSHAADAMRYAVMGIQGAKVEEDRWDDYETDWVL